MPLRRIKSDFKYLAQDQGSAVVEFVGFGLLLQVPLLIVAVTLAQVQLDQFAAEAVARHSLRSYILAGTPIAQSAREVLQDFAVTALPDLQVSCSPSKDCEASGETVSLHVQLGLAQAESIVIRP
jgi:hypothetical protein